MKKNISLAILAMTFSAVGMAQSVPAEGDEFSRGYISRPYQRYEAEPGRCRGNAAFLLPEYPYSQEPIQAEASNGICASLVTKDEKVEWTADYPADAISLRFSLPDGPDGLGKVSSLGFYINGVKAVDVELNSFWAWQYIENSKSTSKHPDNTPAANKFARMRFDEVYVVLPLAIGKGDTFALVKNDDDNIPCTIDFVELEMKEAPTAFEDLPEPKVKYEGDGSTLQNFINSNPGKTIFLPEGNYTVPRRLIINSDNTSLVGAGMWHTFIYFSASASNRSTYSNRGIESYAGNITLQGFTMNSASNMRYLNNSESMGIGKGLQGSFGKNSSVRKVRIDHFECGAWIGDYGGPASDGLTIENCRFRNNYADGVNLCSGTVNAKVTNCSFRNNGDDDMASWSTGHYTSNNEFAYNTAEHNWRASSLGFFGGRGNKAHHISVTDGLEAGVRVTADFEGTGFAATDWISLSDIYIARCGCAAGNQGVEGDLWGNWQPSLRIQAGYHYDIHNLRVERVNIKDSRHHALSITTNGGKNINNLELHNILIDGTPDSAWGIHIANTVKGSGHYSNLTFENVIAPEMSNIPLNFDFKEVASGICRFPGPAMMIQKNSDGLLLHGIPENKTVEIYDLSGRLCRRIESDGADVTVSLPKGVYIVKVQGLESKKICL